NLQADKHRFPSGIANLTEWLHENGFLFGLYTNAGDKTCSSGRRVLKPPGSYGHYQQDANTFAEWEVDYVKISWCGNNLYNAQEQHTGWRVTGDHHDHWKSTLAAIESVAGPNVDKGCSSINPDVPAGHCPGQTHSEYRFEFAIWGITASPLVVATDVRDMIDIMNQVLLNQQNEIPAAVRLGTNFCAQNQTIQAFDGSVAVCLFNTVSQQQSIRVLLSQVNSSWNNQTTVAVTDLWAHQDLGTLTGQFQANVNWHDNAFVISANKYIFKLAKIFLKEK
ncbi:hypothetical protein RFI_26621, partial [Reticulomyxa filosa]